MRRIILAVLAAMLVATGVAGFAAFESHVINVRAHVVKPPVSLEKFLVTKPVLSDEQKKVLPAGCQQGPVPAVNVPIQTCLWWVTRIVAKNTFADFGTEMHLVVVKDNLSAEFNGEALSVAPVEIYVRSPNAKSQPESVAWCVTQPTLVSINPDGFPLCSGPDDPLLPGESASLDILVWTKKNPAGKQEFTSKGDYTINSGATARWLDQDGKQCGPLVSCPSTPAIHVTTVGFLNSLTINTDIDFGTVFPGTTRQDHFELCLADGTDTASYTLDLELKPLDPNNPSGPKYPDMRPYMTVQRDPAEPDTNDNDTIMGGSDTQAQGKLDRNATPSDTCDKWLVTLKAPHFVGEYNAETDPQHGSYGLLPPEATSTNGWNLGADVQVTVTGP